MLVLLVNLLAAGATSYPGVFNTAWILVPLALANAAAPAWSWQPSPGSVLALVLSALAATVLCARTQVSPVLDAANEIALAEAALQAHRPAQAEQALLAAANLDPWSPTPWQMLAEFRLQVWLETGNQRDWEQFQAAAAQFGRRDGRHHSQFAMQGNWLLAAWRKTGDRVRIEEAIDAYRQAVAWYPKRAAGHAQLAWALHLAGEPGEAKSAAEQAHQLDLQNPHGEQKLDRQRIYDPALGSEPAADPVAGQPPTAEQIVDRLRTSTGLEELP
jgi:tetratricopeptide (TPR) repeat protein